MTEKLRKLLRLDSPFKDDEEGAVTADWILLTAAVIVLSLPILPVISGAVFTGADSIATDVVSSTERP